MLKLRNIVKNTKRKTRNKEKLKCKREYTYSSDSSVTSVQDDSESDDTMPSHPKPHKKHKKIMFSELKMKKGMPSSKSEQTKKGKVEIDMDEWTSLMDYVK